VFKSLFIFLSSVALLAAGASLQTGALRLGEVSELGFAEVQEDVESARSDLRAIWLSLEDAPQHLEALVKDARGEFAALKTDAALQARTISRRLATRINTGS
jgi:hypothetical protein